MTTEEKAKAYDEALKRAKAAIDIADAFKAGAEWQKSQMLKDAVEGRIGAVGLHNSIFIKEPEWTESLDRLNEGSKVKIIIVKEG